MDKPLFHKLTQQVSKILPNGSLENVSTLLAVSGGADSIALARLVTASKNDHTKVFLAHFNHGLRGKESEVDELFVKNFAEQLGLDLIVGKGENLNSGSNRGEGLESLAMNARYEFLVDTAKETGARMVLTAHTKDDQVETMVQRFFRGTGLRGLVGIQPIRQLVEGITLVRPLLNCRKEMLISYLESIRQEYRTDQSNFSKEYTRNRIRNELIPLVGEILQKDVSDQLCSLSELIHQFLGAIEPRIEEMIEKAVQSENKKVIIKVPVVEAEPRVILNEFLTRIWCQRAWSQQQMSREKWDQLSTLLVDSSETKINLPGNLMAERLEDIVTIWEF